MKNKLIIAASIAALSSASAHAINEKYRQQLLRSGCTQVSEAQGCDITKSKAENAKAGFVGEDQPSHAGSGAAGLKDLVGARASSGESQLESRGYRNTLSFKDGHSSYTNWRKGSHCVSVRTTNGHYESIVDVGAADCEGGSKQGESAAGGGGAGAADLQDLVGARAAGGETELQNRGYNYVAGSKWSNGWHCVTVRTANGHYKSIVNTPLANCH